MQQPWYQHLDLPWVRHLCATEARWLHIALMHRKHHQVLHVSPIELQGFSGLHTFPWLHFQIPSLHSEAQPDAYTAPVAWPLRNGSVSAVVLWHVDDWSDRSEALCAEALRVLEVGGDLIVMGFQKKSLLGIQKTWQAKHGIKPVSLACLKRRFKKESVSLLDQTTFAFRPWCDDAAQFERRSFFEPWGHLFFPTMGSVYCRLYRKRKDGQKPVGLVCPIRPCFSNR